MNECERERTYIYLYWARACWTWLLFEKKKWRQSVLITQKCTFAYISSSSSSSKCANENSSEQWWTGELLCLVTKHSNHHQLICTNKWMDWLFFLHAFEEFMFIIMFMCGVRSFILHNQPVSHSPFFPLEITFGKFPLLLDWIYLLFQQLCSFFY